MDLVEDKHGARQADYCLGIISGIANWYAASHNTYSSPIVRGMRRTDPVASRRKRILSDDEIRTVWARAEGTYGDMVKLALLTAQRREKLVTMRWRDLKDGVWIIPSAEREKGNPGELVLPPMALELSGHAPDSPPIHLCLLPPVAGGISRGIASARWRSINGAELHLGSSMICGARPSR